MQLSDLKHVSLSTLKHLASADDTPIDNLVLLSKSGRKIVRELIAANPNTPANVLGELSKEANENIMINVIENPNTPVEAISSLIKKEMSPKVIRTLVRCNKLQDEQFLQLIKIIDEYPDRRNNFRGYNLMLLSINSAIGEETIQVLAQPDYLKETNVGLARNPKTSSETLEKIYKKSILYNKSDVAYSPLAENRNTPEYILVKLFNLNRGYEKELSCNRSTPVEILQQIVSHKHIDIRLSALYNLCLKDEMVKDWPLEWVEAHYSVKFLNQHKQEKFNQNPSDYFWEEQQK